MHKLWDLFILSPLALLFTQVAYGEQDLERYLMHPRINIDSNGDVQISDSAKGQLSFEKGRDIQKVWGKSGDYGLVVRGGGSKRGITSLSEVARLSDGRQQIAYHLSLDRGGLLSATNCQSMKTGGKEVQISGTNVGVNSWTGGCLTVTPYMCRALGAPEVLEGVARDCADFIGQVKTVVKSMPKDEQDKLDRLDRAARNEIRKISTNLKGMEWVKEIVEDRPTDVRVMPRETELDFAAVAWLGELCRTYNLSEELGVESEPTAQKVRGKSGPKKSSRPGVF